MKIFLPIIFVAPLHCLYTSESKLKLLTAQQFGTNFPAAESNYRTNVTGGRVRHNFSLFLNDFSFFAFHCTVTFRMKELVETISGNDTLFEIDSSSSGTTT